MKRFGMIDSDFSCLSECYQRVYKPVVAPNFNLPVVESAGITYPGLERVKIFIQKPGLGADLRHFVKVNNVQSDDGQGGLVLTGVDGDHIFNIIIANNQAQVRMIDDRGEEVNNFITTISPKFDSKQKELIIIQKEEL